MRQRASTVGLAALALLVAAPGPASAAPAGNPSSYKVNVVYDQNLQRNVVERWNPCRGIRVKVNPGPHGQAGLAEAKRAVVLAGRASGLRFVYAGTTSYVPRDPYADSQREQTGADLVVGFADSRRTPYIIPRTYGTGGYKSHGSGYSAVQITDGTAFVDTARPLRPGFSGPATRGGILLHEIGHALGLEHVRERVQLMATGSTAELAEYQRGDLTGLRKVGRPAGCIVSRVYDRDKDGIPDQEDRDPDDAANPSTTDRDGDGTVDGRDLYPDDPARDGSSGDPVGDEEAATPTATT